MIIKTCNVFIVSVYTVHDTDGLTSLSVGGSFVFEVRYKLFPHNVTGDYVVFLISHCVRLHVDQLLEVYLLPTLRHLPTKSRVSTLLKYDTYDLSAC